MALARPPLAPASPVEESPAGKTQQVFTGYPVTLPFFEGPLDLLLYLVRQREIEVQAVPLAAITQQYLEWLATLEKLNVEESGDFIVMVASLLEIKSRSLLPREELPAEGEEEGQDPREELERRLLEYQRYREAAARLREQAEQRALTFSRTLLGAPPEEEGDFQLASRLTAFDLWAAFQEVLARAKATAPGTIVRPRVTVAQRIAEVSNRLLWAEEGIRFLDLFQQDVTKYDVIVTFLALLELIRLGRVRVRQDRPFGEIWLEARSEPAPAPAC